MPQTRVQMLPINESGIQRSIDL